MKHELSNYRRRVAPPAPMPRAPRNSKVAANTSGDYAYNVRHALIITNAPHIGSVLTGRGIEFDD